MGPRHNAPAFTGGKTGAADLATLLSNRKAADEELRQTINVKIENWGINIRSVEIRDVKIPVALQDAMSRQAQAERERQARVILGTAEAEIAEKFVDAARSYADNPVALHLRAPSSAAAGSSSRAARSTV